MPKNVGKKLKVVDEGVAASQTVLSNEEDDMLTANSDHEETESANLSIILKELRDFRKDNEQKLSNIHEDINNVNKRIEEVEDRITTAETRIQKSEDVVTELIKLQIQLNAKLVDLESCSRRENIRIYGVKEGLEDNAPSVCAFVERLLRQNLAVPTTVEVRVERAHRALVPRPPQDAPPRSIVAKLSSYRAKEEILRLAWQKRGVQLSGKLVNFDHDYAPDVLQKRKEYAEAKAVLKEKKIRFQTSFPAKLRVHYEDGPVLYGSAEEATRDMIKRGYPVTAVSTPDPKTLLDQVQRLNWRKVKKTGNRADRPKMPSFQEKLKVFRRQDKD